MLFFDIHSPHFTISSVISSVAFFFIYLFILLRLVNSFSHNKNILLNILTTLFGTLVVLEFSLPIPSPSDNITLVDILT